MQQGNNVQTARVVLFRTLFGLGIAYGLLALLELPFVALGGGFSLLGDIAFTAQALVFGPACVAGFWFRRPAVVCLLAMALLMTAGLAFGHILRPGDPPSSLAMKVFPVGLPVCLALLEFAPVRRRER